jgi:cytochrome oxidase Cu insertion factor (SCO1/SenC/PrrC family)
MSRNLTITLFYTGIAVLSALILAIALWIRPSLTSTYKPPLAVDTGKVTTAEWFPIKEDLRGINQDGTQVGLHDLRGKVWLLAQFFAVCPQCAVRNGTEMRAIYDAFRDNPDFHVVCVTVDPKEDDQEKLADYAAALGAESKNWWFINAGEEKATHEYLEKQLGFFGIRERTDPLEIEAQGRFQHDLGLIVVNRDLEVVGKWSLADARSPEGRELEPKGYERQKAELLDRIRTELDRVPAAE